MPTYDYQCTNCNYKFEYFQPMSTEPLTECPECKGFIKRKIGTGAGPIFKGSGFYQTDYKSNPSTTKKESKPESKPKSTVKKDSTSESKT